MKIVVIGSSGLIGTKVIDLANSPSQITDTALVPAGPARLGTIRRTIHATTGQQHGKATAGRPFKTPHRRMRRRLLSEKPALNKKDQIV